MPEVPSPTRAAQYLRMSTERQDYSIAQQTSAIAAYALAHGFEIVATYADEGVSGLLIDQREGLSALLADVISGKGEFEAVLVYDVSRWGRFQNPDQAAYYEFMCSEAGVRIQYCAEVFANDGSMTATLLKSMKRVMAAEYSRELSAKVAHAKNQLGCAGFWQGGAPGYGLRRQHILPDGTPGRILEKGEFKGPQNGRTRLVPGPAGEVAVIRQIFQLYAKQNVGIARIARLMNASAPPGEKRRWNSHSVLVVLQSERYAGVNTVGKSTRRLGAKRETLAPRSDWVRIEGAFEALVPQALYNAAQARLRKNATPWTEEEMLQGLARVLRRRGRLSTTIIDGASDIPASHHYFRRFGSLPNAYRLVGYEPSKIQGSSAKHLAAHRQTRPAAHDVDQLGPEGVMQKLRQLLAAHGRLSMAIVNREMGKGAYQLAAYRLGGGRRMYALAGYQPNKSQNSMFNRSREQTLTEAEAEALRARVKAGEAVPIIWRVPAYFAARMANTPAGLCSGAG